jgi:hypothetical protein
MRPSTNAGLMLPLESPPPSPTALPDCCPDHNNQHDLFASDKIPAMSSLKRLSMYPLYDSSNRSTTLSTLFSPSCLRKQRVLLIFIRNFFCGNCQQFLLSLGSQLPPSSLPSDTAVAIIGCGAPSLLPSYLELTHCPYPLYTDPRGELYRKLGMQKSWSLGARSPEYIQQNLLLGGFKSVIQGLKRLPAGDVGRAGDMSQNGGEFLFVRQPGDGEGGWADEWQVQWCHRMRNTRDHTEIPHLRMLLGLRISGHSGSARGNVWAARAGKERHGKRWQPNLSLTTPPKAQSNDQTNDRRGHKRSHTLQSLSQATQTKIRNFSLLKRPSTSSSWAENIPTEKRSLTPAVAIPDKSPELLQEQAFAHHHRPSHTRSRSAAQILNLRIAVSSSNKLNLGKKGDHDGLSESNVALFSVVSPGVCSVRSSMTPQVGTPISTPVLAGR